MSKELLPAQLSQSDPMKTNFGGCPGPGWLLPWPPQWCWIEIPRPPPGFPPPLRKADRKQGILFCLWKEKSALSRSFELCVPCCRVHLAPVLHMTNVPKLPSPSAARLPRGYQVLSILDYRPQKSDLDGGLRRETSSSLDPYPSCPAFSSYRFLGKLFCYKKFFSDVPPSTLLLPSVSELLKGSNITKSWEKKFKVSP